MGNREKLIDEYLKKRFNDICKNKEEKERLLEKTEKEIRRLKKRISELEHRIDLAYEAFSPISTQKQMIQTETAELKSQIEEKQRQRDEIQIERDVLQEEQIKIQDILSMGMGTQSEEKQGWSKLGHAYIEQQELERKRIARELHDTIVQNLTGLLQKLEICTQLLDRDPIRVRLEMELMSQVIRDSIRGMRDTIYNLRPMTLDDLGFEETLIRAVERLQRGFDTKIVFETEGKSYHVDQTVQLTILRAIQEGVHNCQKYANANLITILLSYQKGKLVLTIMDDGIGFETEQLSKKREEDTGFGLSMMKEGVCLLGGKFHVESKVGFGTEIRVEIPVEEKMEY